MTADAPRETLHQSGLADAGQRFIDSTPSAFDATAQRDLACLYLTYHRDSAPGNGH